MPTSLPHAQIEQLRRDAKRLARDTSIALSSAQNQIAASQGFRNWSLLIKHSAADKPVSTPINRTVRDLRPRHYVHGDQRESNFDEYFCVQCDLFVEADHFLKSHDERTYERALQNIESWNRSRSNSSYQRPATAINILLAEAQRRQDEKEASRSPFHRWLQTQKNQESAIGDLAQDVLSDRNFPIAEQDIAKLRKYLRSCGAIPDAIKALDEAWRDFSQNVS